MGLYGEYEVINVIILELIECFLGCIVKLRLNFSVGFFYLEWYCDCDGDFIEGDDDEEEDFELFVGQVE